MSKELDKTESALKQELVSMIKYWEKNLKTGMETNRQIVSKDNASMEEYFFIEKVCEGENKINKLRENINSVIQMRDNSVTQIGVTNNVLDETTSAADHLHQLKNKLNSEVSSVEINLDTQVTFSSGLLANLSKCVVRTIALCREEKRNQFELMKAKAKLKLSVNSKRMEMEKNSEKIKQKLATFSQKQLFLARIQNANKIFHDDQTEEMEYQLVKSQKFEIKKKLSAAVAVLQREFDKKQIGYDDLKTRKDSIEERKSQLITLKSQLEEANSDEWKLLRTVEVMQYAIDSIQYLCLERQKLY